MAAKPKSPWDVTLSEKEREDFTHFLCREIENAISARSIPIPEIEYWWTIYEQGRTRSGQSMPWQDAADLTSYLGTEKADALRARTVRNIFVDPVYTVEGWGDSAKKAPFVEDFHQWQIESEGLQGYLSRVIQASLVETRGVLEVYEDTTTRTVRKTIRAQAQMTEPDPMTGQQQPVLDEKFQPVLMRDEAGNFIEVTDPNIPSAEATIDAPERVRKGPGYRVLPSKNFLVLPGHAREKADIWGYAKNFTRRWDLLQEDATRGIFDKQAVTDIHDNSDVASERTLSGNAEPVAAQEGDTSEKDLWEIQLLHNLKGKGLRWYVATIHLPTQTLLRLVHEDHATHRYIIFVPFPRSDKSHEGYSFVGHKLITVIEEHTAWRNMLADRASLELSAPAKRQQGALWDPDLQPLGPRAVIDVRDMKEVEWMQIPPAMQGAITREQEIVQASERIAGMNDVVLTGSNEKGDSTLGEFNTRQEAVTVRMDEVIKNLQESLEDLGQVRHAIWLNCVKEYASQNPQAGGMPMPMGLQKPQQAPGLDTRGGQVDTSVIAPEMLEGTFRFKPRGSSETSDKPKQRADYFQGLQALALLYNVWPALRMVIGQNPQAAKSAVEQWLRLNNIPDKQAWLGLQPPIDPMTGQPQVNPVTGQPIDPWSVIAQPMMPPGVPGMGTNAPNSGTMEGPPNG